MLLNVFVVIGIIFKLYKSYFFPHYRKYIIKKNLITQRKNRLLFLYYITCQAIFYFEWFNFHFQVIHLFLCKYQPANLKKKFLQHFKIYSFNSLFVSLNHFKHTYFTVFFNKIVPLFHILGILILLFVLVMVLEIDSSYIL